MPSLKKVKIKIDVDSRQALATLDNLRLCISQIEKSLDRIAKKIQIKFPEGPIKNTIRKGGLMPRPPTGPPTVVAPPPPSTPGWRG